MHKCKSCGAAFYDESGRTCACRKCASYFDYYPESYMYNVRVNNYTHPHEPSAMHELGFATVPNQSFKTVMPPAEGLKAGTIFPELNMPYSKKVIQRGY